MNEWSWFQIVVATVAVSAASNCMVQLIRDWCIVRSAAASVDCVCLWIKTHCSVGRTLKDDHRRRVVSSSVTGACCVGAVRRTWRKWPRSSRACSTTRRARCSACSSRRLSTSSRSTVTTSLTGCPYFYRDSFSNSPPICAAPFTPKSSWLFKLLGGWLALSFVCTRFLFYVMLFHVIVVIATPYWHPYFFLKF